MQTEKDSGTNGAPTNDWVEFRERVVQHRDALERTLRRELIHDPRSAGTRCRTTSVRELADEALCWVLDQWRAKPAATSPAQWMRKRGLQLLDEYLDREALAAESRAEERSEESRLVTQELRHDDEERRGWAEVASLAGAGRPEIDVEPEGAAEFESLASDVAISSIEERLVETESLVDLERALLRLPDLRRKVVALHYLDGLTAEEVAYLTDGDAGDIEIELAEGIRMLREELAPRV